jgi:hypothetical protein
MKVQIITECNPSASSRIQCLDRLLDNVLVGGSNRPGATTHSFELADFLETAKTLAIGGLLRLPFGLRGDRFWPEDDFGRFVSGPRNPVSPMQIDLG